MANQNPRGCGLLALVALVAVVAFLGGRASVSWPGEPAPPGAGGEVAPAIVAPTPTPTPLPTPRAVSIPRATPAPVSTSETIPTASPARRPARTRVPDRVEAPPVPTTADAPAPPGPGCDPSYPTVCIPPPPPDADCSITTERSFEVRPPDPHGLDSDGNGIGCEPIRSVPGQPPAIVAPFGPPGSGGVAERGW